jgi:hypothetical protein
MDHDPFSVGWCPIRHSSRLFSYAATTSGGVSGGSASTILYEIRMDRWEKTVTAPIRLDMFAEIPLLILCLIFGVWQVRSCHKRKTL